MRPIVGIAWMLPAALLIGSFGCVLQESANEPSEGVVAPAPRMETGTPGEGREAWAVFVEALKADPAAPDLFLADADWENVDPDLQRYLLGK